MTGLESRRPNISPLGKYTAELKTKIPEETRKEFEREAHSHGMTVSELLREIVIARVHGVEALRNMYEARLQAVAKEEENAAAQSQEAEGQKWPHVIWPFSRR